MPDLAGTLLSGSQPVHARAVILENPPSWGPRETPVTEAPVRPSSLAAAPHGHHCPYEAHGCSLFPSPAHRASRGSTRARNAAFLAGLPVSLKTPRERLSRLGSAFRFFSLQRSRSRLKKNRTTVRLHTTHSQIFSPHGPTTPSSHGPFKPSPAHSDAMVADWSDRTKAEYAFVRSYQSSFSCTHWSPPAD